MHTPTEAAALWCPMARLAAADPDGTVREGQTVFNRVQMSKQTGIPTTCRCIADRCAMWRWVVVMGPTKLERQPVGFCGIAGTPTITD